MTRPGTSRPVLPLTLVAWVALTLAGCTVHHHHHYCKNSPRHPGAHPSRRAPPPGPARRAVAARPAAQGPCAPAQTLDLARMVKDVTTAADPRAAFARYQGRCVTASTRVFNVEVLGKSGVYRALFDAPAETRGVGARLAGGKRTLMLGCETKSRWRFVWVRRGKAVQITGRIAALKGNRAWHIALVQGCKLRPGKRGRR